jgi:hypothetical protein
MTDSHRVDQPRSAWSTVSKRRKRRNATVSGSPPQNAQATAASKRDQAEERTGRRLTAVEHKVNRAKQSPTPK